MNKFKKLLLVIPILVGFPALTAWGAKLILVNHYDKPLAFTIEINPSLLENLSEEFVLPKGKVRATVVKQGPSPNANEAYLHAEPTGVSTQANGKPHAFFGVQAKDGQALVSGYLSAGIAYSWRQGEVATVTFCTAQAYASNGGRCQ